ncbi:MAG: hypothetical protein Q8R13_03575 [bacterium]|nr:hypothetical protein [bacterium]MDZ4296440.1 hypothetical protein [Patescibacteria group bacterium]
MGLEPADVGYLHFLNEKGRGPIRPEEMEIIGPNPAALRRRIRRPDSYPGILGWREGKASPGAGISHSARHWLARIWPKDRREK